MKLILSVCKLEENRRSKCAKYWPEKSSTKDVEFTRVFTDGIVVNTLSEKMLGKTLCERVFEVIY